MALCFYTQVNPCFGDSHGFDLQFTYANPPAEFQ
jgi:hypothetical protein